MPSARFVPSFKTWRELAGLERNVSQLPQEHPACRRLMSILGIGAVVALTYRSAVDDPARFTSSKKVGPWGGLTPSRNQSGERDVSAGSPRQATSTFDGAVLGGNRHDASWTGELAANLGGKTCAPSWCQARAGAPHRREALPFSAVWSTSNDNPAFRRLLAAHDGDHDDDATSAEITLVQGEWRGRVGRTLAARRLVDKTADALAGFPRGQFL
jgi:hypothetical protein